MVEVKAGIRPDITQHARASRARHEGRPSVSIVSVAQDDSAANLKALAERAVRCARLGAELIVVCASRQSTRSTVSAISGSARLIYGPADATEPQLRAIGLAAATGDVIMLVDDPSTADDAWIEHVSITGAVRSQLPETDSRLQDL